MNTINEVLKKKKRGLHYRRRVILPFSGHLLKVKIEDNILTDFSPTSKHIYVKEDEGFMSIYFKEYKDLAEEISKYEAIKIIIVEKDKDMFDLRNHRKLLLYPGENHDLKIEAADDDILFIE